MPPNQSILATYARAATALAPEFDTVDPAAILRPVIGMLPVPPSHMADIAAGTGRDAAWLAARRHRVTAVEPVEEFVRHGKARYPGRVRWVQDTLPELGRLRGIRHRFDAVLAIAVWHHLSAWQSARAFRALAKLLRRDGRLALSLKVFHPTVGAPGAGPTRRTVVAHARSGGFRLLHCHRAPSQLARNRTAGLCWDWLVFAPARKEADRCRHR